MSDSRGEPEATRRAATVRSDLPPANRESDRIWDLLVLIGASFFAPLIVWANSSERADFPGFGLLGLAVLGVALALRFAMVRIGVDSHGSTLSLATLVFALTNAGLLLDRGVPRLVLLAGSIAVSALIYALKDSKILGMAILWAGLFVFAYPWLVWVTSDTSAGARTAGDPEPLAASMTGEPRDMVLIVLDGYANSVVLSDLYGFDTNEFDSQLAFHGFEVNSTANANYGRTRLSVASVVQLGHPLESDWFNTADFDHLLSVIGGDNVLARWLQRNGYTFTYVESGWFGTRCAPSVDTCIEGPWPDESLYDVSNRSLMKDLPGLETGRSFTRGARNVLDWLGKDLESLLSNDRADLVYAHVLAPHPPLFLDSDCDFRPQEGVMGFTIAQPGMTDTELANAREWYGRQVECVNTRLLEVAELAQAHDAVALMFGDHGPDSLGQLFIAGTEWSESQRWERLSAMLAVRAPDCDMTQLESLVNVGRRLVSCLSDTDLPDLPNRAFDTAPAEGGQRLVEIPVPDYGSDA